MTSSLCHCILTTFISEFYVLGVMNSAVGVNQSRSDVNFLLKDSADSISCVFYQIVSILLLLVMGKSQIKSHCWILNHSVKRFKSLNQVSNLKYYFSSNLKSSHDKFQIKSQIFNFRFKLDTFCLVIFHNIKNNVMHVESVITVSYCNTVNEWLSIELHLKQQCFYSACS